MFLTESTFGGYLLRSEDFGPESFVTFIKDSPFGAVWLAFENPTQMLTARCEQEVQPLIEAIDALCDHGHYAAGFVSYDAAPAFDFAFMVHRDFTVPLATFFIYDHPPRWFKEFIPSRHSTQMKWHTDMDAQVYAEHFKVIHDHIGRGDTYQVNLSFRMQGKSIEPSFLSLVGGDVPPYATIMKTEEHTLASLSPELFFTLSGSTITCKPMKGTKPRGQNASEDQALEEELQTSPKEMAENLMVVDMIRNDLGRIAVIGTVQTPVLFEVERFATVSQMTSTVTAQVPPSLSTIFAALFPCASIVGAPKVATMRIIKETESTPRSVYSGSIGYLAPGHRARFSVAIRTICSDHHTGISTYGIGSGIVWDSEAQSEFDECLLKAEVLHSEPVKWALLETMLWTPTEEVHFFDNHLDRIEQSARQLGIPLDRQSVKEYIFRIINKFGVQSMRMRLLSFADGSTDCTYAPYMGAPTLLTSAVAISPVQSSDPSLRIKTTHRTVYENQLSRFPEFDEVLLWNEKGEITEFCNGNVALMVDGQLVTPPIECGLLPGIYRQYLIDSGDLIERIVQKSDLTEEVEVFRLNSVSGKVRARLSWLQRNKIDIQAPC